MALKDVEQAVSRAKDLMEDEEYYLHYSNETGTRYTIIDPVLRALGWDLSDPEQASFEHWLNGEGRVDYVLFDHLGAPCLVLEAKALGVWSLSHERQLQMYVRNTYQGHAVLTNGRMWKIWDLNQRGRFRTKVVSEFDLSDKSASSVARLLNKALRKNLYW